MLSRFKQLGKDSVVYGIGGAAAKALSVLLLPVFTRLFSPVDFGVIETLVVINGLLSAFIVMGMDSAQSFYFFEQKKQGKENQILVISSILQWRLASGVVVVAIASALSPFISMFFFGGRISKIHFVVAFLSAFFTSLMNQSAQLFRLLYRPWKYIIITLGTSVISIGSAIVLVAWLKLGIIGYFTGFCIGTLSGAILGWWLAREYLDWSCWHKAWWPRLIKFGFPLIFSGLAMYVMNSADRWFIMRYHGEEALGIYAVGAKFALALALVVQTFRMAWWPIALDAMHSSDGPDLFRAVSRLYMGFGAAGVVALTAISPLLVSFLTAPIFHRSYIIVGVLAWHSIFYGYFIIGNAGIWKKQKTKLVPFLMGGAALINIMLNYLWVPEHGGLGAAAATSVSFFIWNIVTMIISEKLWKIGFNFPVFVLQVVFGGAITVVILLLLMNNKAWYCIIPVTLVSVVLLAASGFGAKRYRLLVKWVLKS